MRRPITGRHADRAGRGGAGLVNAIRPPGWMAQGLCTQVDPELFYPGEGGQAREALRVCAGC
ncbi:MAG: WhiB family transcriptional regulator, partial [Thermoleophilaceae bacterium]